MNYTRKHDDLTTAIVAHKEKIGKGTIIRKCQVVVSTVTNKNDKDQWDQTNFNNGHGEYRSASETEMLKHVSMWDYLSRPISLSECRLEPTNSDIRRIHSAPYRPGFRNIRLKRDRVDTMMKDGVAEPSNTECASQVVAASKKDYYLRIGIDD